VLFTVYFATSVITRQLQPPQRPAP
jgi:hypothetical protein